MTHQNDFSLYYSRYRDFKIFDFRKTRNKIFYLIEETQTMSICGTKPLDKILNPKFFITSKEQDFINQLWADSPEMSYVSDDTSLWENLDEGSYANLENAME